MRKIAAHLPTALERGQAARSAVSRIAGKMQYFLASDVVYTQRVAPLIQQTLDDAGVTGQQIADSQFMGNLAWLTPTFVAQRSARPPVRRTGRVAPGLHGHGLDQLSVGDDTLQPRRRQPRRGHRPPTFPVDFQNQGTNDENDVRVTVTVRGRGKTIACTKTVAQTKAGQSAEVDIPLGQTPPMGTPSSHGRRRGGPRRGEDRQQPPDLHGDLHALSVGRRRAPGEPGLQRSLRRARWTCQLHRRDRRARRRALARSRCCGSSCSRVGSRRCARPSASSSATTAATSSATPPSSTATSARCTATSKTWPTDWTGASTTAETRLDGAIAQARPRARPRVQRDVGPPVDVDRAARRVAIGDDAELDRPSRAGADVRQAGGRGSQAELSWRPRRRRRCGWRGRVAQPSRTPPTRAPAPPLAYLGPPGTFSGGGTRGPAPPTFARCAAARPSPTTESAVAGGRPTVRWSRSRLDRGLGRTTLDALATDHRGVHDRR